MSPPPLFAPAPERAAQMVAWRDGVALSRGDFDLAVGGAAQQLRNQTRVILACQDGWNFAVGLMGALTAGAEVILPANDLATTRRGLDGVLVDDDFPPSSAPWTAPPPPTGRLCFYTSGSTGEPKQVVRTLAQMEAEVTALHRLWGAATAGAITLSTVPHQHAFGLVFNLLWPLAAGRPFHVTRYQLWEEVLAALPAGAVLVSSPAHLSRMGGLTELDPSRRPRLILSAGAPLAAEAAADAHRILGTAVTEIYGSTETGAVATRHRDAQSPDCPTPDWRAPDWRAPDWRALPGYIVSRSDDGLLQLESPAACALLADRIDLAPDGGFRLLGRADRIAKIEGKRVALDAVERALAACPQVMDAAVVVLDEPAPTLAAVVVPTTAGQAELDQLGPFRLERRLRHAMAQHLEPAALPRRWRFLAQLPHGPMGKQANAELRALFADTPRLPRLLHQTPMADGVRLTFMIPADLWWFQGHFPDRPILPGVVQLDWVLHFARHHLGLDIDAAPEFQTKFQSIITPRETVELELHHDPVKKRLIFAYRRGDRTCSSGTVYLP